MEKAITIKGYKVKIWTRKTYGDTKGQKKCLAVEAFRM